MLGRMRILLLLQGPLFCVAATIAGPRYDPVDRKTYDGGFDPENISYYAATAFSSAVAGAVLAIACLLGTFVFLLVRCICLCQGNRFCPSPTEQTESYSGPPPKRNRDLLVMKVIIVALAAGALVGVVLGFVGTNKATTTIDGLIQVTVKEMGIDVLKDQLEMMENLVDDILYLADGPSTSWDLGLANLPSTMDDITDEVNSVVEEVEDYEVLANDILGYLEIAGIVIMSLIIIMILIAVAGAALESRGLLICPLVTVPVWIVFSWVLYTAFNTVHTFIDDACRDIGGTAEYCMPGVQNEAMCNSFYIGGILSGFSVDLEPEFIPFTNAVNDLVEQANTALQSSYDSTCSTIGFLSEVLSFADPNSLLQPPDFCDDQSLQQLLCPPFTADGRTNDSCGAKATSTYTMVKIKDFDNGFRIFRCDDVPDMVSSLESAIEEARSQGSIPSGPAIRCASDGQFIGSKLYDDLSAKAKAAGTVLGQSDNIRELVELQPVWDIFTQLTEKDCPSAVDALAFLYAAYCVLAVFLMAGAIAWLVSIKLLPSRGRVAPTDGHDHGDGTGLLVVSQPVATPGKA